MTKNEDDHPDRYQVQALAEKARIGASFSPKMCEQLCEVILAQRNRLAALGICPDCLQVATMDEEEPLSHCRCGPSEDYGRRTFQAMELENRKLWKRDEDRRRVLHDAERVLARHVYPKPDVGEDHPYGVLNRIRDVMIGHSDGGPHLIGLSPRGMDELDRTADLLERTAQAFDTGEPIPFARHALRDRSLALRRYLAKASPDSPRYLCMAVGNHDTTMALVSHLTHGPNSVREWLELRLWDGEKVGKEYRPLVERLDQPDDWSGPLWQRAIGDELVTIVKLEHAPTAGDLAEDAGKENTDHA